MAWAALKTIAATVATPVGAPAMVMSARRNIATALERIDAFPDHVEAIAEGRTSPLPAPRSFACRPASAT